MLLHINGIQLAKFGLLIDLNMRLKALPSVMLLSDSFYMNSASYE